jgi:heme-degrading monooxygenase HmoA
MSTRVRILVWHRATGDEAGIQALYQSVTTRLAGVPGLLGSELLQSTSDPDRYVVMSEWASLAAFQAWDVTPGHAVTEPLRRYRAVNERGAAYEVYEVAVDHPGDRTYLPQ